MGRGPAIELLEQCKRLAVVHVCQARNALTTIGLMRPEVAVFEFDNPLPAHLHLLQTVKRTHPGTPILMLTSAHSEELAVWAFRARVWNYLVKPVPLRELKANLEQLARIARRRDTAGRQLERPSTMMPVPGAQPQGHTETAALQRIIQNIRRDHGSRIQVAELARECGMSRFSFSRLFRRSFGCSYREYVMRVRIESACKMLQLPDASVTAVAIAAGFTDASYFARIFRRHVKKSPGDYARTAAENKSPAHRRRLNDPQPTRLMPGRSAARRRKPEPA